MRSFMHTMRKQEGVAALANILWKGLLKVPLVERNLSALQAKSHKLTLQRSPISVGMKEKSAKAGFDLRTLEDIYKKGGARGLLAMLALPSAYQQIGHKKSKPRVTKDAKVLTKIINFFDSSH